MTLPRRLSIPLLGHGPVLAAAFLATIGLGPPDVTSAVWLDAVPACGAFLLPTLGREAAMMVPMVGLMLVGHGIGTGRTRSWRAAALPIGLMVLLHLLIMLCDDLSRYAGSVALGRDLRAACLAGLVAACRICRAGTCTASLACAARCGSAMATLMLMASLHWSLAGVAALSFLVAGVLPGEPLRERWTSALGLVAAVAVAGWG